MRTDRNNLKKVGLLLGLLAAATAYAAQENTLFIHQGMVPYSITESGHYMLAGHLSQTGSVSVISVHASRVTIDLNGFTIGGRGIDNVSGIYQTSTVDRLTVRNGVFTNWSGLNNHALWLEGTDNVVEGIRMRQCTIGVDSAQGARVRDCLFTEAGSGAGSTSGFALGDGSSIERCRVTGNAGTSFTGIRIGAGSLARLCTVYSNRSVSFSAVGIEVDNGSRLEHCAVSRLNGEVAAEGILTADDCSVEQCAVSYVMPAAGLFHGSAGVRVGEGTRLQECSVFRCGGGVTNGAGFYILGQGRVTRCVARENDYSGIQAGDYCFVSECLSTSNGYSARGIEVLGDHGRYQDNHLGYNRYGLGVTGSSNLIIRNTLFSNVQAGVVNGDNEMAMPLNNPGEITAVANPVTLENIVW